MKKKAAVMCLCALLSTICKANTVSDNVSVVQFCFTDDKSEVRFSTDKSENFVVIDGKNFPAKMVKVPFPQNHPPKDFLFAIQVELNPLAPTLAVVYKDRLVDDSGDVYRACKAI